MKSLQNLDKLKHFLGKQFTENEEEYKRIFKNTDIQQRSLEWFQIRKITASNIYSCVKQQEYSKYIMDQSNINAEFQQNKFVQHGIQFEDLAQQLYKDIFKIHDILEVSLIQHDKFDFIGASPDGYVLTHENNKNIVKLLEIKCPFTRIIYPFGKGDFAKFQIVTEKYLYQCFLQMECAKVQQNDFWQVKLQTYTNIDDLNYNYDEFNPYNREQFETTFKKYYSDKNREKQQIRCTITYNEGDNYEDFKVLQENTDITKRPRKKGSFIRILKKELYNEYKNDNSIDISSQFKYIYNTNLFNTFEEDLADIQKQFNNYSDSEYICFDIQYWRLEHGHLAVIDQNTGWFYKKDRLKMILDAWEYISFLKENQNVWQILKNDFSQKYEIKYGSKDKILIDQRYNSFIDDINKYMSQNDEQFSD